MGQAKIAQRDVSRPLSTHDCFSLDHGYFPLIHHSLTYLEGESVEEIILKSLLSRVAG